MRSLANLLRFLSACFSSKTRKLSEEPSARRRSREEWRQLNEPDLMMELVRDIAQDLDLVSLCFKILLNVGILTNGDRCSLFLIFGSGDQRWVPTFVVDIICYNWSAAFHSCLDTNFVMNIFRVWDCTTDKVLSRAMMLLQMIRLRGTVIVPSKTYCSSIKVERFNWISLSVFLLGFGYTIHYI